MATEKAKYKYFNPFTDSQSWILYKRTHPEMQELINDVYEIAKGPTDFLQLLVSEGLSYNQIAQEMHFRGYRTASGRRFNTAAVKSVSRKSLDTLVVRN